MTVAALGLNAVVDEVIGLSAIVLASSISSSNSSRRRR
jgi:hypothetical protein